jgi:hypothetical protein
MPMIDIHATAGTFSDPLRRSAGVGLGTWQAMPTAK